MAGLFDAIRGAMMVMGGYGDTRREEVKSQSEADYRKGILDQGERKIASEERIASSQRDLTERLQGKAISSQEKMQKSEHQIRKELQVNEQDFKKLEAMYGREFALSLEQIKIDAGMSLHLMESKSRWELQEADLKFKRESMMIDKALRSRGLSIQEALNKGTVNHQNAQIILAALKAAYPSGLEAIYDSTIDKNTRERMQIDGDRKFKAIMANVDPNNEMEIKNLVPGDIVKPIDSQTTPPSISGFTPPTERVTPEMRARGEAAVSGMGEVPGSVQRPIVSSPFDRTATTPIVPLAGGFGGPAPVAVQAPAPASIPGPNSSLSGPYPVPSAPAGSAAYLDPQDQFRLQTIAAFAHSQPDPENALQRGIDFINSPEANFSGHSTATTPADRAFYNRMAGFELTNMFDALRKKR